MTREITEIAPQKRNRQRLNISLDGEYAFSLDRLTAAWLTLGRKLSDAEIEHLLVQDELESAYQRSLHLLSFRGRSEAEMERYLREKGFSDVTQNGVLARLKDEHILDDKRFSLDWIENRSAFRPRSQSQIRAELRRKGVDEQAIEQALLQTNLDEAQLALKAGRKILRRYHTLTWEEFRAKFGNYLARRGFNYSLVNETVRQLWTEFHGQKNSKTT